MANGCAKTGKELPAEENPIDDHHSAAANRMAMTVPGTPVKSLVKFGTGEGAGSPKGRILVNEPAPTSTVAGSVG